MRGENEREREREREVAAIRSLVNDGCLPLDYTNEFHKAPLLPILIH